MDQVGVKITRVRLLSILALKIHLVAIVYHISNRDNRPSPPSPPLRVLIRSTHHHNVVSSDRCYPPVPGEGWRKVELPPPCEYRRALVSIPIRAPGAVEMGNPPSISRNEGEQSHEFSQKRFHEEGFRKTGRGRRNRPAYRDY